MPTSLPDRVVVKPEGINPLAFVAAILAVILLTCSMVLASPAPYESALVGQGFAPDI